LKSGQFEPFFCKKNPFYVLKSYFSGQKKREKKIHPQEKDIRGVL
jgi:hypothetical protein